MAILIERKFTTDKEFYNILKDNVDIFNEIKSHVNDFMKVGITATLEVFVNKETKIGFDLVITGAKLGDIDGIILENFDALSIGSLEKDAQGDVSGYNDFIKNRVYYISRPRNIHDIYIRDSGVDGEIKLTLY
ncbi:MAG: hypothetical protein ACRCX8_03465 [Sarcina sp.]